VSSGSEMAAAIAAFAEPWCPNPEVPSRFLASPRWVWAQVLSRHAGRHSTTVASGCTVAVCCSGAPEGSEHTPPTTVIEGVEEPVKALRAA
jgi:hypothetical protein